MTAPTFFTPAAERVRAARPGRYPVGLVLGSGLGGLAEAVTDAVRFPFTHLPGFPLSGVTGHKGELVAGTLSGVPVVALSGRTHFYETGDPTAMRPAIETLAALGCQVLILTNAAGSTRLDMAPGSLMALSDHIAFSGLNPLIGEATDRRFVPMNDAYDPGLRARLARVAATCGQPLHSGVYMWFSGPSFETPAEIRMARMLGADAIGMSTVPETILARFHGLKVMAISTITNFGAGLAPHAPSHMETKEVAGGAAGRLSRLIMAFLSDLAAEPDTFA